jgi:hypothetical protein
MAASACSRTRGPSSRPKSSTSRAVQAIISAIGSSPAKLPSQQPAPRGRAQHVAGWIVRGENPERAVYGVILIGALIAAESGVHDGYPERVGSTVLALGIYWLAHAYSTVLGRRLSHQERLSAGALARALRQEWTIVRGASIPLLTLVVAWAAGASQTTAVNAAVWAAIASLIAFELLAGLRSQATPREIALESAFGITMGLGMLALKSLAH